MSDYFIRTSQTDYPTLIALGKMLGAIEEVDGQIVATEGGAWDYIGPILRPTGVMLEGGPEMKPVMAPDGQPFVHVNIRTPISLRARAVELAVNNPALAAGLASLPKYFIVDQNGNATLPADPVRVWAQPREEPAQENVAQTLDE
jgi:hypothetical protein